MAALVVLVLLALLAAAVVRLSVGSHTAIAQEIQAARTQAAMRAGVDWGLFQIFQSTGAWLGCGTPQSQTLELVGSNATVACSALAPYNEGEHADGTVRRVRVIRLTVVACNASACPDNAAAAGAQYVERMRELTVSECTQEPNGASWGPCSL